jgi:hypothetical protein
MGIAKLKITAGRYVPERPSRHSGLRDKAGKRGDAPGNTDSTMKPQGCLGFILHSSQVSKGKHPIVGASSATEVMECRSARPR